MSLSDNIDLTPGAVYKFPKGPDYSKLSEEFLKNGIVKIKVENKDALADLHRIISPREGLSPDTLNEDRLNTINKLASYTNVRELYYSLAKNALHEIIGNELVMQRNINLSIQLPGDDSSLLPIHSDSLQGDSVFECVLWTPLCDVYDTKSMFFTDKKASDEALSHLSDFKAIAEIYEYLKPHIRYVDCKLGECLIFSQCIFHGNTTNLTNETRWSLNCRFKSLFSPYTDKKLGEFFVPVSTKPATKFGLQYVRG